MREDEKARKRKGEKEKRIKGEKERRGEGEKEKSTYKYIKKTWFAFFSNFD